MSWAPVERRRGCCDNLTQFFEFSVSECSEMENFFMINDTKGFMSHGRFQKNISRTTL
jgi:hypothetical protein